MQSAQSYTILEIFFGFTKIDRGRTLYFLDAVDSNIGKSTTHDYFKENYALIFGNEDYLKPLVTDIIYNNREDLFKIIEESQGEEYSGLLTAKVHGFDSALTNSANGSHFYSFAERLLDMMSKEKMIRSKFQTSYFSTYHLEGLERFLQILKKSGDIPREKLERLFCYYFYVYNNNYNEPLEILMKQTCDSPNFPIELVNDCIVKRPAMHSCKVYKVLLESILLRSLKKRSRIKIGEDGFIIIKCVVEFVVGDGYDKPMKSMLPLAPKLNELLNDVKEKGLIKPVSFDRDKLIRVVVRYLRSFKGDGDFSRYVSEVNKIMKEKVSINNDGIGSVVKAQGLRIYYKMVEHPYTTIGSTVAIFAAMSILIFKTRFQKLIKTVFGALLASIYLKYDTRSGRNQG